MGITLAKPVALEPTSGGRHLRCRLEQAIQRTDPRLSCPQILELLCQILQTDSLSAIQFWLLFAPPKGETQPHPRSSSEWRLLRALSAGLAAFRCHGTPSPRPSA